LISKYIVSYKKIPDIIDSSQQFLWYKPQNKIYSDITYDYFENYENMNVDIDISNVEEYDHNLQFENYTSLDYYKITPLIKKYFNPSSNIFNIIAHIESKYNLNYENICVLFYRGNDKITETKLSPYDEYLKYSDKILKKNPNPIFLIQSDETEFIEYMTNIYPNNSIYFKDEIRHMNKTCNTVDKVMKSNIHEYSMYYLAITIIMSKCKYIICGTGNCSIWIMLYRNNNKNTIQFIREKWIKTLE
jgi:hypothetical protein